MSVTQERNGHATNGVSEDVRALLQIRADRLKARLTTKVEESMLMVAQFRVGNGQYAIRLADFRAAVPLKLVTPVPLSPPQVVGILRYQGRVITALSLASLLGIEGWRTDPTVLLVVEPVPGQLIGLDSEDIPKPCPVPLAAIDKARERSTGPILDLFVPGSPQINLLDLAALLDRGGWTRRGR
jgi:purine-binding chemotaxis protein CheW